MVWDPDHGDPEIGDPEIGDPEIGDPEIWGNGGTPKLETQKLGNLKSALRNISADTKALFK
jgi:hypothetical protein